jgi:hypothetical protein
VSVTRIDIPDAKPAVALQAADIVIATIREAGGDPHEFIINPMGRAIALAWRDGQYTRAHFIRAVGNLCILNPALRAKGGAR